MDACGKTPSTSFSSSSSILHLFIIYLVISPSILCPSQGLKAVAAGTEDDKHAPHAAERGIGFAGSVHSRWEAIRAWAKLTWMHTDLHPPDSAGKGLRMKEASKRSYEVSKETVEQTAAAAAAATTAAAKAAVRMAKKKTVCNADEELEAEL